MDGPLGISFVGTPDVVRDGLDEFVTRTGTDEPLVVTYAHDPAARRRSYELLADAWGAARQHTGVRHRPRPADRRYGPAAPPGRFI